MESLLISRVFGPPSSGTALELISGTSGLNALGSSSGSTCGGRPGCFCQNLEPHTSKNVK
eukprot:1142245-Prorocentrum_minimum.AAC.1